MPRPAAFASDSSLFDSELAADHLFSSLAGHSALYEGSSAVISLALNRPRQALASPTILEALARLAAISDNAHDEPSARAAAHALVLLSRGSPRAWNSLVKSGAPWSVPFVSRVIVDAVCWPVAAEPWALADDLRALSSGPAAAEIMRRGDAPRTPLAIAVRVLLEDLEREWEREAGGVADAGGARHVRSGIAGCFTAVLDIVDVESWDYVSDDDFGELVVVLCDSSKELESSRRALTCPALLRRFRTGFRRGTPTVGRLYARVSCDEGQSLWPELVSLVSGWPTLLGNCPGFKCGFVKCRMDRFGQGALVLSEFSGVEEVLAYFSGQQTNGAKFASVADSEGWWADEKRASMLAAAYIGSPDAFRARVQASPSVLKEVLRTPPSLQGPVDNAMDASVRTMLVQVESTSTILCASSTPQTAHQHELSSSASGCASGSDCIGQAAIRLRRLALAHPPLVMRRVPMLCGALEVTLSSPESSDTVGLAVASGLLRVLVALHSGVTLEGEITESAWSACRNAVSLALGEGRAKNGVRGQFAVLAIDSCDAMRGMLSRGANNACRTRWRSEPQLRSLLRDADNADGTEAEVRVAIDKLFAVTA